MDFLLQAAVDFSFAAKSKATINAVCIGMTRSRRRHTHTHKHTLQTNQSLRLKRKNNDADDDEDNAHLVCSGLVHVDASLLVTRFCPCIQILDGRERESERK